MTVAIRDSDGTERLRGDLIASGGAIGDVLTQRADGTYAPAAAGGFTPVTCYLIAAAIDIHAAASHPLLWSAMKDNAFDFNALGAIPAGLGATFAFDGSAAKITTTAAGTWAFSLSCEFSGDATWAGRLQLDENSRVITSTIGNALGNQDLAASETVTYPSGAEFNPAILTDIGATANPLDATGFMTIVRLG